MSSELLLSFVAAVGRVLIAGLFIMAGASKLGAAVATQQYIASAGLPAPVLAYWVAVLVEVGGGTALALGWRVRAVAAVLAVFTFVTAIAFHAHFGDQLQAIQFLKNMALAGGLLQIVALGSGSFTLDVLLRRGSLLSRKAPAT